MSGRMKDGMKLGQTDAPDQSGLRKRRLTI
jgi:hypothetical protein